MSAASDKYEKDIANRLKKLIKNVDSKGDAIRPPSDVRFADVKMNFKGKETWCEVKMNHTDNLSNARCFYKDGKWGTTYKTPAAKYAVDILNSSAQSKKFLRDLSKFSGIPLKAIKIPTTQGGLKEEGAVPYKILVGYFKSIATKDGNQYIAEEQNYDLGKVVTEHYLIGKAKPAHYMQAGDDFYRIGNANPFGLNKDIPVLKGKGNFRIRVGLRKGGSWYEIQIEVKITDMPDSKYSVAMNTGKKNPFAK